jgi:ferritin-like metal-binding protein YciE
MRGPRLIDGREPAHGVFQARRSLEPIVAGVGRRPDRFLAGRCDVVSAGALQNVLRTRDFLGCVAVDGQKNAAALFQATILVDQFFNDSTGAGDDGEIDARGPWNQGGDWEFVEAPAFQDARENAGEALSIDDRSTSTAAEPALIQDVLVEGLQDLLHAEGQLVKALPKMARAANSDLLRLAFETHLDETRGQVERLKEAFELLGVAGKPKPCKGMAGLLEEGTEVIAEGEDKDDLLADLAVIASAQKVEHYEISAYGTARALAGQIGRPDVAALLAKSLAEEEGADNLLTQIARELMGQVRTGVTKAPKLAAVRED